MTHNKSHSHPQPYNDWYFKMGKSPRIQKAKYVHGKKKFNKTLFSLFTNSNNENTKLRPNSMKQK
jgi:hypothetical protein